MQRIEARLNRVEREAEKAQAEAEEKEKNPRRVDLARAIHMGRLIAKGFSDGDARAAVCLPLDGSLFADGPFHPDPEQLAREIEAARARVAWASA